MLNTDALRYIALKLDIKDINNLCQTNPTFYEEIWKNNRFWYLKCLYHYDNIFSYDISENWLIKYKNYSSILCFKDKRLTQFSNIKAKSVCSGSDHIVILDYDNNIHC